MKTALITGIAGQDGSYLAELLLARGYRVVGTVRRPPAERFENLEPFRGRLELTQADLRDPDALPAVVAAVRPAEIYHLAALSHVVHCERDPVLCAEVNGLAVVRLLEAVRRADPAIRLFFASTTAIYGSNPQVCREDSPVAPVGAYGVVKAFAHRMVEVYRRTHGLFACCGILFNHESPRRPAEFVSRRIAAGAAAIKLGRAQRLALGSLDRLRDWGFAGDYVRAAWMMLQRPTAEDFVIACGVLRSVRDMVQAAFQAVDLDYRRYVDTDPALVRPNDHDGPAADPSKAATVLGWRAAVGLGELMTMMVRAEMERMGG